MLKPLKRKDHLKKLIENYSKSELVKKQKQKKLKHRGEGEAELHNSSDTTTNIKNNAKKNVKKTIKKYKFSYVSIEFHSSII